MRLAIADGRVDPLRLSELRRLPFPVVVQMHEAQDALDDLRQLAQDETRDGQGRGR